MTPLRVGVIGAGVMGERHARIYASLPDVELVAVCDTREDVAERVARETGAAACTDFRTLLARDDLDAVSVCTPDGDHRARARRPRGRASTCWSRSRSRPRSPTGRR